MFTRPEIEKKYGNCCQNKWVYEKPQSAEVGLISPLITISYQFWNISFLKIKYCLIKESILREA